MQESFCLVTLSRSLLINTTQALLYCILLFFSILNSRYQITSSMFALYVLVGVPNLLLLVAFSVKQNFHSGFGVATSYLKVENVRNSSCWLSKLN